MAHGRRGSTGQRGAGGDHGGYRGEVVAIAGSPSLPSVPIDGRLQLIRGAQFQFVTFVRVEILHVSETTFADTSCI